MEPAGLGHTRILTDDPQKSPPDSTGAKTMPTSLREAHPEVT